MRTKPPKETTAGRISQARLTRLLTQNEKLKIEVRCLKGEVGPIENFKQEVLKANTVVKTQLLALPHRLAGEMATTSDPKERTKIMQDAIVQACNDLAYSREIPPDVCPCCGAKLKEEVIP